MIDRPSIATAACGSFAVLFFLIATAFAAPPATDRAEEQAFRAAAAADPLLHRVLGSGSSGQVHEAVRRGGQKYVTSVDSERDIAPVIRDLARPGDMVMCFGAGNSTEWAHALPGWLAADETAKRAGGQA